MQINIYEFDHALFKTSLPNSDLYTPELFSRLENRVPGQFSWYRSSFALSEALNPSERNGPSQYCAWSKTLLKLVREDMDDPHSIPVLYCNRYTSKEFLTTVVRLIRMESLVFELVWVNDGIFALENLVKKLLMRHPDCTDLSFYTASYLERRDQDMANLLLNRYPDVNYFRELCPFQLSMLDPEVELKVVQKFAQHYVQKGRKDSVYTAESDEGLRLKFSVDERQRLFRVAYNAGFEPGYLAGLTFAGDFIHVCHKRRVEKVLGQFLGPPGTEILVVAKEFGYVEGRLYAVKFSRIVPNLGYVYGDHPIALIAYEEGLDFPAQTGLVNLINNWTPLQESLEVLTMYPKVDLYKRLDIVN